MVRSIYLLDKISLHTQAEEVISSEQQPLLLPCLSLEYVLFKSWSTESVQPFSSTTNVAVCSCHARLYFQMVVRHSHHPGQSAKTAYTAIAKSLCFATTTDLNNCLHSAHLTFRHLVKVSGSLVTQNSPHPPRKK